MSRPRMLDLFSGAGGAAMGYYRAGFDVTGVDNRPQPHYPFRFIQADALEYLALHGNEFDAAHASPPCQGYSRMRHLPWLKGKDYPLLIDPTRDLLALLGIPWVIENVEDAPLRNGVTLCGVMFDLKVYRHRKFESNVMLLAPAHQRHPVVIGHGRMLNDRAQPNDDGWVSLPSKGQGTWRKDAAVAALGIDWMSKGEIAQAIPPVFTEYLGRQLILHIDAGAAALSQEGEATA